MNDLTGIIPIKFRIELHRLERGIRNSLTYPKPSIRKEMNDSSYPYLLFTHSSKLIRKVPDHLVRFQYNKVKNLIIVCDQLDKLLFEPGEYFSFCRTIGRTSKRKGYEDGLEMRDNKLVGLPGGGLCQMANLLYWMILHLNLEVVERHTHEQDLFPDDERIVPFGMGATVFYNYRDFCFRNTLQQPLLLRVQINQANLVGKIFSSFELPFKVNLFEKDHRYFEDEEGTVWRENHVFRRISFPDGSETCEEIAHNLGKVHYQVDSAQINNQ